MSFLSFQQPHQKIKTLGFTLGFTSIIAQILLLREFLSVFYGNEIVYALILFSWLFWVAAGSLTFSRLTRMIKTPSFVLSILLLSSCFLIPLDIVLVRLVRSILHVPSGEIISITPMALSAFGLLMPLTFVLGAMFTCLCRLTETLKAPDVSREISTVYLWEGVGAAIGGVLYSFVLVHFFKALAISVLLGVINIAVVLLVFKYRHVRVYQCAFIFFLVFLGVFASGYIEKVDDYTRRVQWKDYELVEVTDSIYGNIALVKRDDEYSLFVNGILSFSTRDQLSSEENAHFPMLAHSNPHKILLIGGGVGGALNEILKYKNVKVDYVELDPKIIDVCQKHLPAELLNPLKDERVTLHYQDARLFVKQNIKARYDVIILNTPDPYTAFINRYYTLEFFREAKKILKPYGVLSMSVSSSENYLNHEARRFLRSLNTTLHKVFAEVKAIPGDTHFFLAGKDPGSVNNDAATLGRRIQERNINATYVREYYLPFRLSPDRMSFIQGVLSSPGQLNLDMRPITYLYDIILFSTHFNTQIVNLYKKLEGLKFWHLLFIPAALFFAGMFLNRGDAMNPIKLSIMTTGFSEIIFQIVVIMAFQSLYGYAYYKVGLILSSFMLGLVFGSLTARGLLLRDFKEKMRIYKIIQIGICVYPLLLSFIFVLFRDTLPALKFAGFFATIFAILPIVAGYMGGVQYPLAAALLKQGKRGEESSRSAGFLYALDVLGASFGALLTGTILIPLLGIHSVLLFCVLLNSVILCLFYIRRIN